MTGLGMRSCLSALVRTSPSPTLFTRSQPPPTLLQVHVHAWEDGTSTRTAVTRVLLTDHTTLSSTSRFAEVEAIAVLTMLVTRYKVEVKEEPQFASETFEERKARILASHTGLTNT